MGYDVKMFIGEVSDMVTEDGRPILTIAMIDLCNPGDGAVYNLAKITPTVTNPAAYLYSFGGNESRVIDDQHGKRLAVVGIQDALEALRGDSKSGYRRFEIALATLEAIVARFSYERLGVVFYGY